MTITYEVAHGGQMDIDFYVSYGSVYGADCDR